MTDLILNLNDPRIPAGLGPGAKEQIARELAQEDAAREAADKAKAEEFDRRAEIKAASKTSENKLQADCEAWLLQHGYWPRLELYLNRLERGEEPPRGWQYHLHAPKRNPPLLDLLILDVHHGRYMEIELKVANGEISWAQNVLIARGGGTLALNLEQVIELVTNWEGGA